ncbi:unnamed protein product [Mytilus edulis]|uniref:Cadherin domain-containing protein n=1 Tax=Mytilus edulis TaxID=6550 RepID=A0A8S3RZD8_MYTED|nr:unnamed protein product [Mytilus edulis]
MIKLFLYHRVIGSSSQSIQQPRWNNDISDLHEKPENLPLDSKLATISATGHNGVDVILITYGTETERRVSFNYTKGINAVGTVYLKEEMDREEMSTWELYFKAYDSKIGPDQNALKGYIVTAITASDPDNGNGGRFSLRLESAHLYQAAFNISQKVVDGKTVGTVTLKRELDYEILSFYQYLIIATPLPIRVLAIDRDIGVPNEIIYSFKSDLDGCHDLFRIDQSNGTVYTNTMNLDRDDKPINTISIDGVCRLTLEAKELNSSGLPQHGNDTTTTPFVITIVDKNDNLPKFNFSVYQAAVDENTTNIPLRILKPEGIVVTDIDQIFDGIQPDPKSIRGSGNIQLRLTNQFKFDFEVNQTAQYRLVATEKGKSNVSSDQTCIINITINDINDNYPVFTALSYTAYASEYSSDKLFESESILNVTATDLDSGIRGNITFTLGGDPHFSVSKQNATTAEIRTVNVISSEGVLDRETRDKYYLTIEASDGEGGRSNARLNVFITDLNDNSPVFVQGYRQFSVKENQPTFDSEIVINATDNDQKNLSNSQVRYKIYTPSYLENNFTINNITGNITLSAEIDFEGLDRNDGKVTLTVEAYDLGSPSMSTNESIDINFQDVNDNVPEFTNQTFIMTVVENADSGTHVGTVSATDKDGTPTNSKLTYYIDKGDREKFRMNGATGDITVDHGAKIDREEYTMYNITVLAIDRGTPSLNSSALLFINITDQNDAKPKFNQLIYVTSVNESANSSTTFTVCPASDEDLDSVLVYSIIKAVPTYSPGAIGNESADDYFGITNDGHLYVKSGALIDREVIYHVQLQINVTDVNGVVNVPQTDSVNVHGYDPDNVLNEYKVFELLELS